MRALLPLIPIVLSSILPAQGSSWIANRATNNIMEVDDCGIVVRAIDMGTSLRSAHQAPDGKVWVVRFIQGQFDIVDPATTPPTITTITASLGNPYSIAFDAAGTAWVTGGTGVEQFSANGAPLQAVTLPTAAPLGITVDVDQNIWIAHRVNPGVISRIDGTTGAITSIPVPSAAMQPVSIVSDFRGLFTSSHIWVVGDSSNDLVEYDAAGTWLRTIPLPGGGLGNPVTDINAAGTSVANVWVGSYQTGDLHQVDVASGAVTTTVFGPSINGLALDHYGRLRLSQRITFSPPGPPCQCLRVDPANPGIVEHPGLLEVFQGGVLVSSGGTQSALATMTHFATVVDPFGDLDNDSVPNIIEIQNGSSPTDPWSVGAPSIVARGVTQLSGAASLDVRAASGALWIVGLSEGLVAPGSGITQPGWANEMLLDPLQVDPGVFQGIGSQVVPVTIPNVPAIQGLTFFAQGIHIPPAGAGSIAFTNVTCFDIW